MTAQSRAARRRSMRSMPGAARMAARFQRPRQPITPSATSSEAAAQPSVVAPPSPVAEVVVAAPVVQATPAAAPVTTTAAVEATPVVEATPAAAPPAVAELSAPVASTAAVEATPVVEATPIVAATPLAHVTAAELAALVEAAPIPAAEATPPVAATPAMTKATRRRRSASRNRRPSANRGEATPAPAPPTTMGVSAATATVPLAPTTEPAVAEAPVAQVEAPTPTATTEEAKPRRFFSALGEPPQELPSAAGAAPLTDATTATPPPLPAAATLAHATTAPPPPATPAATSRARMSRRPQRRRYTVTAAADVPPAAAVEPPQSAQPKQVAAPPPAAAEAPTSVAAEAAAPATAAVETAPSVESAPTQHRRPVMSRSVLRKNKRMTVGAAAAAPSITEVSAEAKEADVPAPEISAAADAAISAPVDDSAHHSEPAVEPVAEAPKPRTFFVELDTLPTGMEAPSTATATVEAESAAQGAIAEEPPHRPTARAVMRPNFRKRQKTSTPATVDDAPTSNTSAEAVPMEQPEERSDVSGKAEESETVMNPEDTPVVDASMAADVSLNEATPPVEVVEVPEAVSAVEAPEVVLDVSELLTDEDIHQSAAALAVDAQTAHVEESSVVDPFTMIAEAHTIPVAAVEAPKATRASRRRVPKKKTKATQRNRFLAKLKEYEQHANHHPTQDNHVAPVVAEAAATSSLPSATPANGENIEGHHDAKDRVEKATEREPVSTPHEDESSATPVANDTPVDKPLIVKRATARKKIKAYQALSAQRTAAPETAVATEEAVNEAAPHAEAPTGESGDAAPAFLTFPCDNVVLETFNENEMVARRSSLDDPWDIGLRYDWNVRALAIGSLPTFKETDPRQKHPFLQRFHARPAWHLHEVNGVKASQLSDVMAVLGKSLHARFVFRR